MGNYYDGTKLLSLMDINGNKPEIYICTSNRSAGKTTYFGRLLVNRFLKKGEKFMLIYRYNYELDECADKFFKDIQGLFFRDMWMDSTPKMRGSFHMLYLNDENCGYAVSLNNADNIKKYSHFFSDVKTMLMDEFQSETNHYCSGEVRKFISIHQSVARGGGKQSRYLPVYLLGNPVTLLNPYYVELGISNRLSKDTKFLRGKGYVLEQGFNKSASENMQNSAFNQAFSKNEYIAYSQQCIYLNDNETFIERPQGRSYYLATMRYNSVDYAIREFVDQGIVYCDDKPDMSCKQKIVVTTDDHNINYVMLNRANFFLSNLRNLFEKGCFRFKDLRCKEALLKALSF